jgi:small multidrug resistance pump
MNSSAFAWFLLGISVISEVAGTVALKHSDGFSRFAPAVAAGFFYVVAVWLMSISMKQLEMGITYAVWAGCGTAITALAGIAIYGESASSFKLAGLSLVIIGIVLLNLGARQ